MSLCKDYFSPEETDGEQELTINLCLSFPIDWPKCPLSGLNHYALLEVIAVAIIF